jgi:hypothetical protein
MNRRRAWTTDEIDVLRERFPHERTAGIAADIGRSYTQVAQKAAVLGITKTHEFMSSELSGRVQRGKQNPKMRATQFKPGESAWNKGVSYQAGGRSQETQFKKGQRHGVAVALYQPIGTERTSKDGYLERKINDDMPLQRRWRAVHLIEWEAVNGPMPPGHCLCFKDGDKNNRALTNLELITRAERIRRNSYHTNYPKEVGQLIQLKGALNRKINRRSKQA